MSTELILMDDVNTLGLMGEKVVVSDGYARNYLIPQGKAVVLDSSTLKQLEKKKIELEQRQEKLLKEAQVTVEKFTDVSVTIPMETAENEKLYGSVTAVEIATALETEGINIDKKTIILKDPIKELGVFDIEIRLHKDVATTVKVWVVKA